MVSNFSVHRDRDEAIRRGQEGFEFFSYAVNALVAHDVYPGRSTLFADFLASRAASDDEIIAARRAARSCDRLCPDRPISSATRSQGIIPESQHMKSRK